MIDLLERISQERQASEATKADSSTAESDPEAE